MNPNRSKDEEAILFSSYGHPLLEALKLYREEGGRERKSMRRKIGEIGKISSGTSFHR